VHSAKLKVIAGGEGAVEMQYSNRATLDNGRNTEVTLTCDPYVQNWYLQPLR
jgi:hypothetical protein